MLPSTNYFPSTGFQVHNIEVADQGCEANTDYTHLPDITLNELRVSTVSDPEYMALMTAATVGSLPPPPPSSNRSVNSPVLVHWRRIVGGRWARLIRSPHHYSSIAPPRLATQTSRGPSRNRPDEETGVTERYFPPELPTTLLLR
jgi:hypothetical protein